MPASAVTSVLAAAVTRYHICCYYHCMYCCWDHCMHCCCIHCCCFHCCCIHCCCIHCCGCCLFGLTHAAAGTSPGAAQEEGSQSRTRPQGTPILQGPKSEDTTRRLWLTTCAACRVLCSVPCVVLCSVPCAMLCSVLCAMHCTCSVPCCALCSRQLCVVEISV